MYRTLAPFYRPISLASLIVSSLSAQHLPTGQIHEALPRALSAEIEITHGQVGTADVVQTGHYYRSADNKVGRTLGLSR